MRQKTGHPGDRRLDTLETEERTPGLERDRRLNNLLLCCAVGESPPIGGGMWLRRSSGLADLQPCCYHCTPAGGSKHAITSGYQQGAENLLLPQGTKRGHQRTARGVESDAAVD